MQRQPLLSALQCYVQHYPQEEAVVGQFVRFIKTHEDCFSRQCSSGHITGSAWLLDATRSHLLMTHHRKLGRWLQLGGHSDGDPNPLHVALREAAEESGLEVAAVTGDIFDIDVHAIPPCHGEPAHLHYDVRYALINAIGGDVLVSAESHALAWVRLRALTDYTREESLLRMRRKWFALQAH